MKKLKALKPVLGSAAAPFTLADVVAVQALNNGIADEAQQKRAIKWILEDACGLPVWAYSENPRETDVGLGRQFVGQQIVGLTKLNISELRRQENG